MLHIYVLDILKPCHLTEKKILLIKETGMRRQVNIILQPGYNTIPIVVIIIYPTICFIVILYVCISDFSEI